MRHYLRLIRVKHWIKNLFVFLPLVFSGNIFHWDLFLKSIWAFISFCLLASVVYILNDYIDVKADRMHPKKKERPLASGKITKSRALALLGALLLLSILFSAWVCLYYSAWSFGGMLAVYLVLNLLYSAYLKHVSVVDLFIIAVGFVLRVLAGGSITGIAVTNWSILLTFSLALVLAVGKRREELMGLQAGNNGRKSLDGYTIQFTDMALSVCCTLSIICYVMFTLSPEVQEKFHNRVFFTVIFVIFGFLRYLQQAFVFNKAESPTQIICEDRYLQVTLFLWLTTFLLQIYIV